MLLTPMHPQLKACLAYTLRPPADWIGRSARTCLLMLVRLLIWESESI